MSLSDDLLQRLANASPGEQQAIKQLLSTLPQAEERSDKLEQLQQLQNQMSEKLAEIQPLANAIARIFVEAIYLDKQCERLFNETRQGTYEAWCSNIREFDEYLPRIESGPRGFRVSSWHSVQPTPEKNQ